MDKKKIGEYLTKIMIEKNVTRTELAETTGLSVLTLQRTEDGESFPHAENIIKIIEYLHISLDQLIYCGMNNLSELKKFVSQDFMDMKLRDMPVQPDEFGKSLLDYVIEANDFDKFHFFYTRKCYTEKLHTHRKLLLFLISNNKYDFLSEGITSYIPNIYGNGPKYSKIEKVFEFPILGRVQTHSDKLHLRDYKTIYSELSIELKQYVDTIFQVESEDILKIIPNECIRSEFGEFPLLLFLGFQKDCVFIVDYYLKEFNTITNEIISLCDLSEKQLCFQYINQTFEVEVVDSVYTLVRKQL